MKPQHYRAKGGIWIAAVSAAFVNLAIADTDVRPQNYSEMKSILDVYAQADDMMDEKLINARESLRSKGDEAIPALLMLFKETTNDQYRAAIVDALQHNKGPKSISVTFLAGQLEAKVEQWHGQIWIAGAIRFLTTTNPEQARNVSRRALNAQSDFVKQAAISSLAEVGTTNDIERLRSFATKRRSSQEDHQNDGVLVKADAAIRRISDRASPER